MSGPVRRAVVRALKGSGGRWYVELEDGSYPRPRLPVAVPAGAGLRAALDHVHACWPEAKVDTDADLERWEVDED